jgi:hypothetical protein
MSAKAVNGSVWDNHYRLWDTSVAILAWAVTWGLGRLNAKWVADLLSGDRSSLYGTVASIFGALLGFVITSLSIVIGFMSSERMEHLRKAKVGLAIFGVFIWGSIWVGIATVVPLVGLVFDRDGSAKPWMCALLVGSSVAGAGALIRCLRILASASKFIMSSPQSGDGA